VGDVKLGVIGEKGALVPVTITKTNSRALGWNSSGVFGPISISGGSGSSDWPDITNTPTTLAGYGITDSITAALAASTYQPLIGTGTLALSKLATDPLARANHTGTQAWSTITGTPTTLAGYGITDSITAALAASTYQTIITDGSLTIARTNGLQAALDAKESALTFSTGLTRSTNTITVNTAQNISRLVNLTGNGFVKTSGSDGTLVIDTNTYITGSTSIGGNGGADGGKVVKFNGYGGLNTSADLTFYAVGGGTTSITVPDSTTSYGITLPQGSGTLALTSDLTVGSLSGFGTGVKDALAINVGSAGGPVLFNGAGGTPSSITLTNASGTASSLVAGYATAARGLQTSSTTVAVSSATAPSAGMRLTATSSTAGDWQYNKAEIVVACSDEATALTTGTAKVTFRMPHAMTLTSVRLQVNTAPTGSVIIVDVKEAGTTIFSTKPQIATSAFTSVGGAVPGVISDTTLADDAEITINLDQIGSTIAGKGLKVTLIGTRP
jgi:hypothetical protein